MLRDIPCIPKPTLNVLDCSSIRELNRDSGQRMYLEGMREGGAEIENNIEPLARQEGTEQSKIFRVSLSLRISRPELRPVL
jgi:hypothetical protein